MANYAIGDIQGCWHELQLLLQLICFNPNRDRVLLLGDLVNRGDASLEVLRWAYQHQDCVDLLLGNHDIHLIARYYGCAPAHRKDTLETVLQAQDVQLLISWLRQQPLLRYQHGILFVHAGLAPQWQLNEAVMLAQEVNNYLSGEDYLSLLAHVYGNEPCLWQPQLRGWDRLRLIINGMTRIRCVDQYGALDFSYKGTLAAKPAHLLPWFAVPWRATADHCVVCGHWSALGLYQQKNIIALDSGCIWGGALSALRIEDRKIFQVPSSRPQRFLSK